LLNSPTVRDVRPADEYAVEPIPGALNASLTQLEQSLPTLTPDAGIVAWCHGPRCIHARQAVAAMRKHGRNAHRLDGGWPEWAEDGRQTAGVG
jgi:ArsR family transcriptional regulator